MCDPVLIIYRNQAPICKCACPTRQLDNNDKPVPQCFFDHNAPNSVQLLFMRWSALADETDNGRIEIVCSRELNPSTGKMFSHRIVRAAIKWLVSHRLIICTHQSHGGKGSTYWIRWSIKHGGLSSRQKHQNRQTRHLPSYIEERQKSSSLWETSSRSRHEWIVSERANRWSKAQLRQIVKTTAKTNPSVITENRIAGLIRATNLALSRCDVRPGHNLAEFIDKIRKRLALIEPPDDSDPSTPYHNRKCAFAWAATVVRDVLKDVENPFQMKPTSSKRASVWAAQ